MSKKNVGSKYTEDWLPLKDIVNGYILLENGEKVTGVKISPKNIFILDQESQFNTLNGLKNFYNTIDFEFWIICADRPVDISVYLSQLQLMYNNVQVPSIRKLIMQDINKANMFIKNSVVDTEYFLLFKAKDEELIQKRIRLMIGNLANCGLNSAMVSNDDLRVILDNFLNGGMTSMFNSVMPE